MGEHEDTAQAEELKDRPEVVLLATGGTIASRPDPDGGVVARAPGEEVLDSAPRVREHARIRVEDVMNVGAYLMTPERMMTVAGRVRSALADEEVAGVVVTHGTDTMEETAYVVDLLHDDERPVVFTGAQRNAAEPDTDGPRNLTDAVRLAASPRARGMAPTIMMSGSVEAARDATKVHTTAPRAFASPGHGPLGEINDRAIHIPRSRTSPDTLAGEPPESPLPRVDLVKLYAGVDGLLVRASREAGAEGVVIEGFGLGNANHEVMAEVERSVAAGVTVMVVSRCAEGHAAPIYGNGGGHDLAVAGAIFGGDLGGQKARLLLMLALVRAREGGASDVQTLLTPHLQA
ncbi:asparaginase [Rubrobacter aplysinae]|uniref:asparaginase n=1 Tax=Rubrobacter aplysinae TaxID=909625 RepID=UPI00064C093A|nr:asparaginase [Rubrobacter aplysinae]